MRNGPEVRGHFFVFVRQDVIDVDVSSGGGEPPR